jgi:hypothetical protein
MSARGRTAPGFGAVRMRRALALAGCGVLTVGISACESTEQESAKITRESQVAAAHAGTASRPLHASKTPGHPRGRVHQAARAAHGKLRSRSG